MNKKTMFFVAFMAICLLALPSYAQTVHYSFGKASDSNRHEVGTCIKTFPDGSSIIAGYYYNFNTKNGSPRAILMRAQGQSIIWSREIAASGTETVTDMIITKNQDIVIVGYCTDTITKMKSPSIYRFDNSGTLLAQNRHRVPTSPQTPTVFTGVCELPLSGKILAVGNVNPDENGGIPARGYIATYQGNLSPIDFEIINSPIGRGLTFNDVASYGSVLTGNEGVTIAGSYTTSDSIAHASLADFNPPSSPSTGSFNSYAYFNISGVNRLHSKFTQLHLFRTRIFCSGILSQDKKSLVSSRQFSFHSNYGYTIRIVHPFDNSQVHTNVSKIWPVAYIDSTDDFGVLITEHPNQNANDPIFNLDMPVFKGVISQISSLKNHTISYSRSADFLGRNPSFNDINEQTLVPISKTADFVTGAVQSAGQGVNIEYTVFSPQLTDGTPNACHVSEEELDVLDTIPEKQHPQPVISHIWPPVIDTIRINNYPMVTNKCGIDTFHSEKCAISLQTTTNPPGHGGGCNYTVTATNISVGYTVISYTWIVTGNPPVVHNTNASSDAFSLNIPTGLSKLVTVIVNFLDVNGQQCTAQLSTGLGCNGQAKITRGNTETTFEDLNIYPNPTSDLLNIEFNAATDLPVNIQLFDQLGRCVKKLENNKVVEKQSKWSISVADLPSGVYNCQVSYDGKVFNKKFVVIK